MNTPPLPRGKRWARVDPETGEWVRNRVVAYDLAIREPIWSTDGLPVIHAYTNGTPIANRAQRRHPQRRHPLAADSQYQAKNSRPLRTAVARRRPVHHGRTTTVEVA